MGKKRSAARRAAATPAPPPAPALAPTASPAVPFDTHTALVDTPPASTVKESPTNTQRSRVSREADAIRAPRAASPAHLPVETTLAHEPANADAPAAIPVAIATPYLCAARALDSCPEQSGSPAALTTPTSTSNDVSADSPQQPRVSHRIDTLTASQNSFPALSAPAAAAAADFATAIDTAGPPTIFLMCPTHLLCRAEVLSYELDALASRTCPATSIEEIDEALLANIIADAQNLTRIEARREVRVKALAEGRERGWKEGLEEGRREARRDARREARADTLQQEQGRKDVYEQGRWEGYREGFEVARTEVSTSSRVDTSVQTDDAPHATSPATDPSRTTSYVDVSVQLDVPPLPLPSRAGSPPSIPIDTIPTRSRIDTNVQTDNHTPTLSPPVCACTTTLRVNAGVQFDAIPMTSRVPADVQIRDPIPTHATAHVDTGIQAEDLAPPAVPPSPPDDTHSPHLHIQASAQTEAPSPHTHDSRVSVPTYARTLHEIEPDLLREIIATASTKGEVNGFTNGKHIGFQDGMEAGWKSGTREGHREGYGEGKKVGIEEGREQCRSEVRRISRAVAIVQTDEVQSSCTDFASQTPPSRIPALSIHDTPVLYTSPHISSDPHVHTTSSDKFSKSHHDLSRSHNDPSLSYNDINTSFTTAHTHIPSFSWADEACSLPTMTPALIFSPPPRDFSILRSSSARPFDSLKRRARRSQARPARLSWPPRPFIPSSEPIVKRRHPAGLRVDRPSVIVSSSPSVPSLVKLDTPPLDWQGDPRLQELGRVLGGLGWVHGSGS